MKCAIFWIKILKEVADLELFSFLVGLGIGVVFSLPLGYLLKSHTEGR